MPSYYTSPLITDVADGGQIAASTVETIMVPDFTFAANDPRLYQGAMFHIRQWFDISNVVTTPGTVTFRIRWGGVGGTILAQTAAISMDTTARANFSGMLDADLVIRAIGAAAIMFCQGQVNLNNVPAGAAAAPQGMYTMGSAGANVPAQVTGLDTTTSKALSVTAQFSVNTAGTQLTNHVRKIETVGS